MTTRNPLIYTPDDLTADLTATAQKFDCRVVVGPPVPNMHLVEGVDVYCCNCSGLLGCIRPQPGADWPAQYVPAVQELASRHWLEKVVVKGEPS